MDKTQVVIKKITLELLAKLDIQAEVSLKKGKEGWEITINTTESGLLIGYHGTTLNAFQLILANLVFRQTGQWQKILVNVGDYRQKREETLKKLAEQYKEQAIKTKQTVVLPYLSPFERRTIHLIFQNDPEVVSESIGEGRQRRLTIKPKINT